MFVILLSWWLIQQWSVLIMQYRHVAVLKVAVADAVQEREIIRHAARKGVDILKKHYGDFKFVLREKEVEYRLVGKDPVYVRYQINDDLPSHVLQDGREVMYMYILSAQKVILASYRLILTSTGTIQSIEWYAV